MKNAPILILQMQRMGDLVLSFPLMEMLSGLYPRNPLWVVGERDFFEPLRQLSPPAVYFDLTAREKLQQHEFLAVINLSHRREAAALAGELKTEALIGQMLDKQGRLFIHGNWQLYRASLTRNNRYNLFHWSDLNCLDVIPSQQFAQYNRALPKDFSSLPAAQRARIGLFVGASEEIKHPTVEFWSELAGLLLHSGFRPVLLGGAAEKPLGAAIAEKLNAPAFNLCGRFSIDGLVRFIRELGLLVVPDTGPMHLAARAGTPVLNLSLGPVNAWETGPAGLGHHVARAGLSCVGCWHCSRDRLYCHEQMRAKGIAGLIRALVSGEIEKYSLLQGSGYEPEVLRTDRRADGLYALRPLTREANLPGEENIAPGGESPILRQALSRFWQAWFGNLFGFFTDEKRRSACADLESAFPDSLNTLRAGAAALAADIARSFRTDPARLLREPDFWQQAPEFLHPFSGYIQMYAQNAQGSREAFVHILSLAERLAEED